MNKGIIGFVGGVLAGVLFTLAAATLIPEDYLLQDHR